MSPHSTSFFQTPVCNVLGCEVPVVLAGMGGVARAELVAAVSNAGGFGFLGMVRESPALISTEIAKVRALTRRGFGVNLIPAATAPALLEAELDAVISARVAAVTLFWDLRPDIVRRLRDAGCLVVCQVGSLQEGQAAVDAGAQILIAQGIEAGGHVRGTTPLADLVHEVATHIELPVLAAGGIVDGKGLAAMLKLGAQGVVVGTGFLATRESFAHDYHKQRIVDAVPGDTIHTNAFHVNWPIGAPVRVLRNSVTRGDHGNPYGEERRIIGHEEGRPIYLFSTDSPLRNMTGDFESMALYAGEGVGLVDSIPTAAERLNAIVEEAVKLIAQSSNLSFDDAEVGEFSSPACLMHEVDDAFMGYATRNELINEFTELLKLFDSVARMESDTVVANENPFIEVSSKQNEDSQWRAMLHSNIQLLIGTHGSNWCSATDSSSSIAVHVSKDELHFLYLECITKNLRRIIPRVRNNRLHQQLFEMLHAYENRIANAVYRGVKAPAS